MRKHFGGSRVADELYQWFTNDAGTLSYGYMGTLHLLSKPEGEAMKIMKNAARRLAGKKAMEWRDFVQQNKEAHQPRRGEA